MPAEMQRIESGLMTLPHLWDGKEAILELRAADFHWKQMEWIGWHFEHLILTQVAPRIGLQDGPTYGNTEFDFQGTGVWDIKAHVIKRGKRGGPAKRQWAILNDQEAIGRCIAETGSYGAIIAVGDAEYDTDGSFKQWHDKLKGDTSAYEHARVLRGASSRRRKISFAVKEYAILRFDSPSDLTRGLQEGWLKPFQAGMRNSDGSPRRPKYMVDLAAVPPGICQRLEIQR